jgi:hypothetical protein
MLYSRHFARKELTMYAGKRNIYEDLKEGERRYGTQAVKDAYAELMKGHIDPQTRLDHLARLFSAEDLVSIRVHYRDESEDAESDDGSTGDWYCEIQLVGGIELVAFGATMDDALRQGVYDLAVHTSRHLRQD